MSNLGLFIVGTLVTLIVPFSMALLFWGAVLDGRDEEARRAAEREVETAHQSAASAVTIKNVSRMLMCAFLEGVRDVDHARTPPVRAK